MSSTQAGAAGPAAVAAWVAARLTEESGTAVASVDITSPARAGVGQSSDTSLLARRLGLPVPELSADYLLHRRAKRPPQAAAEPGMRRPGQLSPTPKAG